MKLKKRFSVVLAAIVCASTVGISSQVYANPQDTMQKESIYDVLVDRFFDKSTENNYEVDGENPEAFAGGDFAGITKKVQYFDDLDFTFLSIGSILEAEDFRGKLVTDYSRLQKNFGTKKEYLAMHEALHKVDIKVMADFPINGVSKKNALIPNNKADQWVTEGLEKNTINWVISNPEVQQKLIDAAVSFTQDYKLDGIRLTAIQGIDEAFLNELIQAVKLVNPKLKVISDNPSKAEFDLNFDATQMNTFQQILKNNDLNSVAMTENIAEEPLAIPNSLMLDELNGSRFTYFAAQENMFPPTRVKIALGVSMMLPGTPIMTYGTEIAMNGKQSPESLQGMDFRTKDDIIKYIGQLQALRNGSKALQMGNYKELKNENGFIVFERYNDSERWIIVVNNTMKTQNIDLSEEIIGNDKEMFGMFEQDVIRENDEGDYRIVVDRELVEVFQVKDKKGINIAYLAALGVVYVLFIGFIVAVLKRGKKKKNEKNIQQ